MKKVKIAICWILIFAAVIFLLVAAPVLFLSALLGGVLGLSVCYLAEYYAEKKYGGDEYFVKKSDK